MNILLPCKFKLTRVLFFYLIFFTFFIEAKCQRNISLQAQKAVYFFNNCQYSLAVNEFRNLLKRYPKDPLYQYYMGVSLLETNNEPIQACEYLKLAAIKNIDSKSWFYLGKSYYRQFRFDESEAAYNEFIKNGSYNENKILKTSKEIERLKIAKIFFSSFLPLTVISKKTTTNDSTIGVFNYLCHCNAYNSGKNWILSNKIKLAGKRNLIMGACYFFSSSTNNNGKDLFLKQKHSDSVWSEPQNLGNIINTSEDEDYPFYDIYSKTLYFASKGHSSVGGFDIFKSIYDSVNNKWSKPIQLPFPINSPWDDYLWFENDKLAWFVSNRECNSDNSIIYQVEKPISFSKVSLPKNNELLQLCMLKEVGNSVIESTQIPEQNNDKPNLSLMPKKNILDIVSKALDVQRNIDSVFLKVKKCKQLLNFNADKGERASLFSEIARYERIIVKDQTEVNQLYAMINEIQNNCASNQENIMKNPEKRELFKFSIGPDTLPYSDKNPFINDISLFKGVIYRIQLGVYSKPVGYDYFGELQPISTESLQDGKIIKYYVGLFQRYIQAETSLMKIIEYGFKEAFIIAYYNGKKIPVNRAKELEASH